MMCTARKSERDQRKQTSTCTRVETGLLVSKGQGQVKAGAYGRVSAPSLKLRTFAPEAGVGR
jgi:hypothetical protein